jgi:plasmid stability protein
MLYMDTTIRNLDARLYRSLRARAAREGRTVGALINEAVRAYLLKRPQAPAGPRLFDLPAEDYPAGNERLSERVDEILYGRKRS